MCYFENKVLKLSQVFTLKARPEMVKFDSLM